MKKKSFTKTKEIVFNFQLLSILLLLVIISFSCGTEDTKIISNETLNKQRIKLAEDLMNLWETGDTLKTGEIFADSSTYEDVANNRTFYGIQGVNKYVGHVHSWGSDIKMEIRNLLVSDDAAYIEWTFTAKQTSPIKGMVLQATNKPVTLKGVTLIKFSDDKIITAKDYMDVLGFVLQLGSKIELPGGVIINK